jgi:hypothetical protein
MVSLQTPSMRTWRHGKLPSLYGYTNEQSIIKWVLWHVTPCRLLDRYQRFEGNYFFHLQGRRLLVLQFYTEDESNSFIQNNYICLPNHMVSHSRR